MGCGGSKEEVATANVIATKPKQNNTTTSTNPTTVGNTEAPKEKSVEKTAVVTSSNVKDIAVNDEGKVVSKESPDRYFSSRKDEISIEIEHGNGYHTPVAEGNGTPRGEAPTKVDGKEKEKEKVDNKKDNLEGAQEVEKNSKIAKASIAKTESGEESKTVKQTLPKADEKKEENIPEKKETEKDESKSTSA